MKERPILFNGPMVRAILDGRKTQTRRAVKNPPVEGDWIPEEMCATTAEGWQTAGHSGVWWCAVSGDDSDVVRCPYGVPGDRLWVRETHAVGRATGFVYYRATRPEGVVAQLANRWRPSIHMSRSASRITLEVTEVRVERLQDISTLDAMAEGIPQLAPEARHLGLFDHETEGYIWDNRTSVENFAVIWDSINGAGSWDSNPWVWAVSFRRIKP